LNRPVGALGGAPRPGVIDEDAAHHLGRYREELDAILPSGILRAEPQVGFVNEVGGLQCVTGVLAPHIAVSSAPQLCVNEREERTRSADEVARQWT
jgi:hypothetical protein